MAYKFLQICKYLPEVIIIEIQLLVAKKLFIS